MAESEDRYFVVDDATGKRVVQKALPLSEAQELVTERQLEESKQGGQPRKLVLKQYLKG